MPREATNQDVLEAGPQPFAGSYEQSKNRLLAKIAIAAGSLALAITAAGVRPNNAAASPKMKEVGVLEPQILSRNLTQSEQIAQMIKTAGFNSFEIRENYIRGEAGNVENDWQAFCNAAQAGQEQGLYEYVTFQGRFEDGSLGYVPTDLTNYKKFNTTMITYLDALAEPSAEQNPTGAHRCSGLKNPVTKVSFGLLNEPNDPDFMQPQSDSSGNYLAPAEMVNLYAYEYPRLKAEAKKLGVKLIITAGALNPNSVNGRTDIDFVDQMGEVIKAENIKLPIFDKWDMHPYTPGTTPQTIHPNGADIGPSDVPMLSDALNNTLGYRPAMVGGEYGVQPFVPADKINRYAAIIPNVSWTDEAGQAQQYHDTLAILACTPKVNGLYFFLLVDNYPAIPWGRSGIFYPDGTPKSSAALVEQAVLAAESGTIANCQNPHR